MQSIAPNSPKKSLIFSPSLTEIKTAARHIIVLDKFFNHFRLTDALTPAKIQLSIIVLVGFTQMEYPNTRFKQKAIFMIIVIFESLGSISVIIGSTLYPNAK